MKLVENLKRIWGRSKTAEKQDAQQAEVDAQSLGLPPDAFLEGLDKLDEAWTTKDLLDASRDWKTITNETPINVDIHAIWNFFHYAYRFRGPVRNVVNNLTLLTGMPALKWESEADQKQYEKLGTANQNRFPGRFKDIIRAAYLWSDYLTIAFDQGSNVRIRNAAPYTISRVETDAKDPELVIAYARVDQKSKYKADQVVHTVLDRIAGETRGFPILTGAMRPLHYLYKLEEDLHYLAHVRARLPVVREVSGGSAAVTMEANRWQYLPAPGRMVVQNKGMGFSYPPAYAGLEGADDVWSVFARSIAMTANLPYFLVTQDFRENSLASSLSADSPVTKWIESNRETFNQDFRAILGLLLGDPDVDVAFAWPPVIERNKQQLAQVYEIGMRMGAVSAQDFVEDVLGKSWDDTKDRMDDEAHSAEESFLMRRGVTGGNGE